MRLLDTVLFSLCVASFIIGVHEIITVGFAQGYWLIMLSSLLFLWYSIRKRRKPSEVLTANDKKKTSRTRSKKSARSRK